MRWLPEPTQGQPDIPQQQVTEIIEFPVVPRHRDESFLRQKYLVEGLSTRQIAAEIFSARSTVVSALKRFGIPLRQCDVVRHRTGQLRYGERVVNGKVVMNRREIAIIDQMAGMRKDGCSFWEIARILNSTGVSTKSGDAQWQAPTVMKILRSRRRSN